MAGLSAIIVVFGRKNPSTPTYSLSLSGKFFYPQPKCLPLLDIASQCPSLPLDYQ